MTTFSLGQIIIIIFLCFLLFGDIPNLKQKIKTFLDNFSKVKK